MKVGSAAISIARAQDASVVGIVTCDEQVEYVRELGADHVVVSSDCAPTLLASDTVDGVIDTVGGTIFTSCVSALRPNGTLSLVGAVAGGDVRFDPYELIRPVVLTGYSSESLDGAALREAIVILGGWLTDGSIKAPARQVFPLRDAVRAHSLLERRAIKGRVLLVPSA